MTVVLGLATRLRLARLLVVAGADDPAALAGAAAGADIVQLRDPHATAEDLAAALQRLRAVAADRRQVILGVADPQAARLCGADLLHLTGAEPVSEVRPLLHSWALVGRSCHTAEEVEDALADPGVDYFSVGPALPGGLDLVRLTATLAPLGDPAAKPWFAVGGITGATVGEVIAAGARRVAVSGSLAAPGGEGLDGLRRALEQAWQDDPGAQAATFAAFAPVRSEG